MKESGPVEINLANWREYASTEVHPNLWTAVVPAAGRGSRLGFDRPKILYPVAGRTILEWLLDLLLPNCGKVIFVVSPDGKATIGQELERLIPGRYGLVIQEVPIGMGDAVALGVADVVTENVAVIWGDQVALRSASVSGCFRLHEGPLHPEVTCPTVLRAKPYIHFERNSSGAIVDLLQAREGDTMPVEGESDTGFFCFTTKALRSLLAEARVSSDQGRLTKEFNLLPIIPLAARRGSLITPRLMSLQETVGINSQEDARFIEGYLRSSDVRS